MTDVKAPDKAKGKGGKARKRQKNHAAPKKERARVVAEEGQIYGQVTALLGTGHFAVQCADGRERRCHVRGNMRKKVWIKLNDVVLITPRSDRDSASGDIIHVYSLDDAHILKREGHIATLSAAPEEEDSDCAFDFAEL